MSGLKTFYPANRLSAALQRARPVSVEQCLRSADENLRLISAECAEHVSATLDRLESVVRDWPRQADRDYMESVFQLSLRLIGAATAAGFPKLDSAAASLCRLIEAGSESASWDRESIEIHVRSMRILRLKSTPAAAEDLLLGELAKVLAKFSAKRG